MHPHDVASPALGLVLRLSFRRTRLSDSIDHIWEWEAAPGCDVVNAVERLLIILHHFWSQIVLAAQRDVHPAAEKKQISAKFRYWEPEGTSLTIRL